MQNINEYPVGSFCKELGVYYLIVRSENGLLDLDQVGSRCRRLNQPCESYTPVLAKDVYVVFAYGIEGKVEFLSCDCCVDRVCILRKSEDLFIEIPFAMMDPYMYKLIIAIYDRQIIESDNIEKPV